MLLESGDKQIVEHNKKDDYWGDGGGPGKGLNKFGELLMEVSKLRAYPGSFIVPTCCV